MNPNLLKQLAIVVKQGSLSRACEQLFITQPTLTRSIKQLEMRVGAPVLTRTRHGVIPTEIGARLAQIGERILAESEHGQEVIRQWHSGYKNEFIVGVDPLWEFATVAQMTAGFLAERAFVFHLRTGSAASQIRLLQEGELDFLLAPAHLTTPQQSLEREVLFRDRSGVFAGKRSQLLGQAGPVSVDQLEQQNWILAGASAGFLDGQQNLAGNEAAKIAFTGSIRSVLHLLETTDMLVRLPARLALMTGAVELSQLIEVQEDAGVRRDIALWLRAEDEEKPDFVKVRSVIKELVQTLDRTAPTFGLAL
ncbi:LysR family transcriptional regulator [Marinobacterium litorale]|jgi:DNA-binding transcriptional LysR family regulator|uniref:LysR family transcriptional regulator n=1 Tax=Marinobacterium litorale TaxID=404770 RepID=UPI00040612C7|nr:LysR family transcriptional regulator [Marinobacterium litorale]